MMILATGNPNAVDAPRTVRTLRYQCGGSLALGLLRYCNASEMFAESGVDYFYCTMRKNCAFLVPKRTVSKLQGHLEHDRQQTWVLVSESMLYHIITGMDQNTKYKFFKYISLVSELVLLGLHSFEFENKSQ